MSWELAVDSWQLSFFPRVATQVANGKEPEGTQAAYDQSQTTDGPDDSDHRVGLKSGLEIVPKGTQNP